MTIKLYCMGESGNAYKAALKLELSGLNWEPVWVDFFNGETRSETFRSKINALGEVPVMEMDGKHYAPSGVILDVLAKKTGRFGPEDEEEHQAIAKWIYWDNHKMSSQAGVTRFLINLIPKERQNADVIAFMQGRTHSALAILNTHLQNRDWVAIDRPTIADFSCCSYLYYPEPFGYEAETYPEIARWLANIRSLPGWQHPYDLMPRMALSDEQN